MWKYIVKGAFCIVYQVSACVEAAAASFGENVTRHCGNVSGRHPGLSCTYAHGEAVAEK